MAGQATTDNDMLTAINVTPLVDITLVLLVIFMVTAQFITPQGVPMDLPRAVTAGATQSTFTVSVDAQGRIYADGRAIRDTAALQAAAKAALVSSPEARTVIEADGKADYAAVLEVVDTLRQVGMVRIAFAAQRVAAQPVVAAATTAPASATSNPVAKP